MYRSQKLAQFQVVEVTAKLIFMKFVKNNASVKLVDIDLSKDILEGMKNE